jgi:hypothetical protein
MFHSRTVALFWLVGPVFYGLASALCWFFPELDWHIVRYIPIPEFQKRTNILVPLGNGLSNRYAIICVFLTIAFLIQTIAAVIIARQSEAIWDTNKTFFSKFRQIKTLAAGCILNLAFCYVVFFVPELVIESNTKVGTIYNATDVKFFVYWGFSIFVSIQTAYIFNFLVLRSAKSFTRD